MSFVVNIQMNIMSIGFAMVAVINIENPIICQKNIVTPTKHLHLAPAPIEQGALQVLVAPPPRR